MTVRQLIQAGVAAAVFFSPIAGCTSERPQDVRQSSSAGRKVVAVGWDTLWVLGGQLQDSTLLQPSRIAAGQGRVYVFDLSPSRLLAVDAKDGSVAWTAGRRGSGPGEFKMVRDLELSAEGWPMLLDGPNSRISTIDRSGAMHHHTKLANVGYVDQFAPLADGRTVLLTGHPDSALAVIDRAGRVTGRIRLPWEEFAELHPIVRQGDLASSPSGRWVFGFGLGDGWFGFSGTQADGGRRRYVEAADFPQVVTRRQGQSVTTQLASYTPCSACSMSIDSTTLYVLFGGRTEHRRAILDLYDLQSGSYLESIILPMKATEIRVSDGIVFALVDDPAPALIALQPRRR